MYVITGEAADGTLRLEARAGLDARSDFEKIAADLRGRFGVMPIRAVKRAPVLARRIPDDGAPEEIVTIVDGKVESTNTAGPGDWVVTALDLDGNAILDAHGNANVYAVRAAKFASNYLTAAPGETRENGALYRPLDTLPVDALPFPGGIRIMAPWNEEQRFDSGYLVRKSDDVYGVEAGFFDKTYERIG